MSEVREPPVEVLGRDSGVCGMDERAAVLAAVGLGRGGEWAFGRHGYCQATAKQLIERYARRMNIEQRLAESIRSFHVDALAGSVPLNVDLDVTLSVLASAVCASLRRRLTGYHHATPDTLQRRFLSTEGRIINDGQVIIVRLNRRTYSPVLRHAEIPGVAVPWWGDRTLRFEYE